MDINSRFRQARMALGLNQTIIAKTLNIQPSFISNIEKGLKAPPKRLLELFCEQHNVNLNWLFTGEGEMFIQKLDKSLENINKTGLKQLPVYSESDLPEGAFVVPLLDQHLSAGKGLDLQSDDVSIVLVRVPAYLSKYGNKISALTVDGDSMYPTLHRGDMVVCDSCGWSGEGIYALRMSGSGFVKRITKKPGKIVIISDNPKYPPQEEPEESQDIQLIGRVHCAITKVE